MKRAALFILMVIAVGFTGCMENTPVIPTKTQPPEIIIDYQRTGGVAGLADHLVIFGNGEAILKTKTGSSSFTLNKNELDVLRSQFENASFVSLLEQYKARHMGEDYFTYVIMYQGKTVTFEDTAVPDKIEPIITALNSIVAEPRSA